MGEDELLKRTRASRPVDGKARSENTATSDQRHEEGRSSTGKRAGTRSFALDGTGASQRLPVDEEPIERQRDRESPNQPATHEYQADRQRQKEHGKQENDKDAEKPDKAEEPEQTEAEAHEEGESELYRIGYRVALAWRTRLHEPVAGEPLHRRLRVYSINPGMSEADSGYSVCHVPYEPLAPGPCGAVMEVCNKGPNGETWAVAELEDPHRVMQDGYQPSLSDPRFHQQMVYAVAMSTYDVFRKALGRHVSWSFQPRSESGSTLSQPEPSERRHAEAGVASPAGQGRRNAASPANSGQPENHLPNNRLRLRPHGAQTSNAWYNRATGEITFGYFKAKHSTPVVQAEVGHVFTSLSHDVIVHETTHALLDGLRAHFMIPSHPDVLAFHEAFADMVAVFQHFTIKDVVARAICEARGNLREANILVDIAQEFGRGMNADGQALRTLIDLPEDFDQRQPGKTRTNGVLQYAGAGTQPHMLGRVLARAVFSAFLLVFERRTRRYIKLATGGSGELPAGDLPDGLVDILVEEVARIARQFLRICIRAIDYCPPVDLRFGDYLRALITADRDVVPADKLGYRDAIIKSFGQRGIFGEGTRSMTEDALLWGAPTIGIDPVEEMSFCRMEFDGDPARPVSVAEMRRQAGALGRLASKPGNDRQFGLVSPLNPAFGNGGYELPLVESVRSARRVGVDHEVHFDTVAELVQHRHVALPDGRSFSFFGGSTVILGPCGEVRFVIRKRVDSELTATAEDTTQSAALAATATDNRGSRIDQQIDYMKKTRGELWIQAHKHLIPRQDLDRHMCTPS